MYPSCMLLHVPYSRRAVTESEKLSLLRYTELENRHFEIHQCPTVVLVLPKFQSRQGTLAENTQTLKGSSVLRESGRGCGLEHWESP